MQQVHCSVREAASSAGALRSFVFRRVLRNLAESFCDAPKALYEGINLAHERNCPLNVPGCSFEYTHIDLDAWMRKALWELGNESYEEVFDELETAQLHLAFYGPGADEKYSRFLQAYLNDYNEYLDYLDRLLFIYNATHNPFKRLEMLIVHLLTNNQILCYSTSTSLSKRTFGAS